MRRLFMIAVITATLLPTMLSATSKSYDVIPYSNCIAQTDSVAPSNNVTQYVRNTLDSLTFVWFWVGDTFTNDRFNVEIRDSITGVRIAQTMHVGSHASRSWTWLPCTLVTTQGYRPVRGRTYSVQVSRQNGGAISFAYDPTDPYKYGHAVAAGSSMPMTCSDDYRAVAAI